MAQQGLSGNQPQSPNGLVSPNDDRLNLMLDNIEARIDAITVPSGPIGVPSAPAVPPPPPPPSPSTFIDSGDPEVASIAAGAGVSENVVNKLIDEGYKKNKGFNHGGDKNGLEFWANKAKGKSDAQLEKQLSNMRKIDDEAAVKRAQEIGDKGCGPGFDYDPNTLTGCKPS